ncbi:MAG: ribokinase [Oscillospiraceae bacterium]|nr:ribokinase [Oscillospiraceae bacterium]
MKILDMGSLNLDFVYHVDHVAAPGETLPSSSVEEHLGGKGLNQSIACAKAGACVYHAGKIGSDGMALKEALEENGVNTQFIDQVNDTKNGHAIIQVDKNGQNSILLFAGSNYRITEADVDRTLAEFEAGDILLLQNETTCVQYAIKAAHDKGMQVVLNPSPMSAELASMDEMKYVDWFILNEVEGNQISGETEPEKICDSILTKYPNAHVMLTLGGNGCMFKDKNIVARHPIFKVKVVDTTAAGDTFTGYFLAGVVKGLPMEKTLELASKASAIAVGRPGASPSIPSLEEVESAQL